MGRAPSPESEIRWSGHWFQRHHVTLPTQVLTVNLNSMFRCDATRGILTQANIAWDQASQPCCCCCDVVTCREMDSVALISHACVLTYDNNKWCEVEHSVCVSVEPSRCSSVFVHCLNYMHLSLPLFLVIQVYVCLEMYMEMNMQSNTRISLNNCIIDCFVSPAN